MRVQIDEARCEGHGQCEAAAPGLFHLDDDGMAHLTHPDIPENLRPAAEAGVRACPVAALLVVEA